MIPSRLRRAGRSRFVSSRRPAAPASDEDGEQGLLRRKRTPYISSGATTVQNSFRAGTTAYVAVAGMPRGCRASTSPGSGLRVPSSAPTPRAWTGRTPTRRASSPRAAEVSFSTGPALRAAMESRVELRAAPCADFSSTTKGLEAPARPERDDSVDLAAFAVDTTAPAAPVLDGTPPLLSTWRPRHSRSRSEPGTSFLCASTARVAPSSRHARPPSCTAG